MWSLLLLVMAFSFSNFVHSFSTVLYEAYGSSPSMNLKGCNPRSNRITNGVVAEIGEIPWQISLVVRYLGTTSVSSCGGSIISSNSILTAAHCFDALTIGNDQYNYYIKRSSVYVGGNLDKRSGKAYELNKVLMHPNYTITPKGRINDLAIIKVMMEFEFQSTIQPICLLFFKSSIPDIGSTIVGSGWGRKSYTDTKCSPKLLRGDMQVYSFQSSNCPRGILSYAPENSILCVHTPSSCTCQGDSGGPLTMEVNGICTLVGVTSQGYQCGEIGYGALHTNVSAFLDWILENIHERC